MFALIGKKAMKQQPAYAAPLPAELDDKIVLPRPLRRMVRFMVSLATGRIHIPAHTGTLATFVFFGATMTPTFSIPAPLMVSKTWTT